MCRKTEILKDPTKNPNRLLNTDHPRRCKHNRKDGSRCKRWALIGLNYCLRHCGGGRAKYNKVKHLTAREKRKAMAAMNTATPDNRPRDAKRLRFYAHKLGPKLNAFVEECLANPEADQLSLLEELHVMRALAGDALELHTLATALPIQHPERAAMLANASTLAANALEQVRVMAKTAADNFAAAKDKYSVHSLHDVVAQIKRMVYASFEHDPAALDRFDAMLGNELRLPKIGNEGTTLTPDQDVLQMDASIGDASIVDSIPDEETDLDNGDI